MTSNRYWLLFKAVILRALMRFSMFLHGYPFPRPPSPTFTRRLPARLRKSPVRLLFYTPPDYNHRLHQVQTSHKYPVVVNFHGGGFCLGSASDDARWARTLTAITNAVVVSVDYRLAPEHAFPAAVDDGVDTLLYLQEHADELGLDTTRVALTGFSAGGNLAFTVPLMYHSLLQTTTNNNNDSDSDATLLTTLHNRPKPTTARLYPPIRISAILSWYPILDFVVARDIRRKRSILPSKTIPPFLTNLFDNGYLPNLTDRESPFASPLRADDELLAAALPRDIFMYMCEWDMLEHEGREFVTRLENCEHRSSASSPSSSSDADAAAGGAQLGKKKVRSMLIEGCSHAWDKSPNPFRDQGRVDVIYADAGEELKAIFERDAGEV